MITINGKTYQIIDLKGRIKSTIEEWISAGYLEEVKENKDSILEKLRNGLEKRKQKMIEENWGPSYIEQVVWTLAVLDSLETKEEPVPPTDKGREQYLADHPEELARQPQEDIELPGVPDYTGNKITSEQKQISAITKFCQAIAPIVNQLIKANKK